MLYLLSTFSAALSQGGLFLGMDYQVMVFSVRKYLRSLYQYRISFDLRSGRPFIAGRTDIRNEALPSITNDVLELLLQQMYEDGYVIKDDGQTVQFSATFIFG